MFNLTYKCLLHFMLKVHNPELKTIYKRADKLPKIQSVPLDLLHDILDKLMSFFLIPY